MRAIVCVSKQDSMDKIRERYTEIGSEREIEREKKRKTNFKCDPGNTHPHSEETTMLMMWSRT